MKQVHDAAGHATTITFHVKQKYRETHGRTIIKKINGQKKKYQGYHQQPAEIKTVEVLFQEQQCKCLERFLVAFTFGFQITGDDANQINQRPYTAASASE